MTTLFFVLLSIAFAAGACGLYYFSTRAVARREGRRLGQALSACQEVFSALDDVPNKMLSRELRKGLVMIVHHNLEVLTSIKPNHPHLHYLQTRLQRLNKIPSAFEKNNIRTKTDRRAASLAFERLAAALKSSARRKVLTNKQADMAAAAALFAGQQIAVETARQAAKDAENVRAYRQALNCAQQAQALCLRLPPLMGKALSESISADVERLESQVGRAARI